LLRRGQAPLALDDPSGRTVRPVHQLEVAIHGLDDGGAALDPIAAIEVVDAPKSTVASVMNVAADNAVKATPPGLRRDRLFECADIGNSALDAVLKIGREGPIAEAEMTPAPIQRVIEPERELVTMVAEACEPARRAHDHVELIAVDDVVAASLRCRMHDVLVNFDAAEAQADVVAQSFVVIAGHEHEARTFAHLAQKLL